MSKNVHVAGLTTPWKMRVPVTSSIQAFIFEKLLAAAYIGESMEDHH